MPAQEKSEKHGGGRRKEPFEDVAAHSSNDELLALHDAMAVLADEAPLKAQIVELRYFGGLTGDQVADVSWNFAKHGGPPLGVCSGLAAGQSPRSLSQTQKFLWNCVMLAGPLSRLFLWRAADGSWRTSMQEEEIFLPGPGTTRGSA